MGGLGGRQRVSEMETGFMRKVMALNFDSLFFNTRAALPLLKDVYKRQMYLTSCGAVRL